MTPTQSSTDSSEKMEATFSVLAMSIASSAAMSMGMSPHPQTDEMQINKNMAKFNIDLLLVLKDKTKGNLTADENRFIDAVLNDLQMKFVTLK